MSAILELFFPHRCAACNCLHPRGGDELCPSCKKKVQRIQPPVCYCCGVGKQYGGEGTLCADCLVRRPLFGQARAYFAYQGVVRELLHQFKFDGNFIAYRALSFLVSEIPSPLPGPYDYVIPVPLHSSRLRQRGFNQSWLLAKLFYRNGRGLRSNLLRRCRPTATQISLQRNSRRKNVRGAFAVKGDLAGATICLVDDVLTTGSTADECAKVLLEAGASVVDLLVLARVAPDH